MLNRDPTDYLRELGEAGEGPHQIAEAALMLSALDHSGHDLEPYLTHLQEIAEQARLEARLATNAENGALALANLLAGRFGYDGDRLSYDDPRNADFIAVIDRRRGLPVALGIIYVHAARAAGFDAVGLNSPWHFLLRIGLRGSEALVDPFNGGAALEHESFGTSPLLRGTPAEAPSALKPLRDIDVLLRLESNLLMRARNCGEQTRALEIAKRMVLIAPRRAELWIELAHLNETEGALGAAHNAYEACLALAPAGELLHNEAALGLQGLKRRLN